MSIEELRISGYRSIRKMRLSPGQVTVVSGANGCGKSNIYRALRLLAHAASGAFSRAIAEEGGMPSVLWAGHRRARGPRRMSIGATIDGWSYDLKCGPVAPGDFVDEKGSTLFAFDPAVKSERLSYAQRRNESTVFLDWRDGSAVLRNQDCGLEEYAGALLHFDTALAAIRDPHLFPELAFLRERLLGWRFYHGFRTDGEAPSRIPQVIVQTPVLSDDGRDLAAALATIRAIDPQVELDEFVDGAFPGARLVLEGDAGGLSVALQMPGIIRPMTARELSDGTLRYLCLLAALLSPRPPEFIALNEPEASLHTELLEPLAMLVAKAAKRTQIRVSTHSQFLAEAIEAQTDATAIRLELDGGETRVKGQGLLD